MQANTIIVNGRRMQVNGGGIHGSDITRAATSGNVKRRAVFMQGGEFKPVDSTRYYGSDQLQDRYGRPMTVKSMPDRTKG